MAEEGKVRKSRLFFFLRCLGNRPRPEELAQLIGQVRSGEAPIEELRKVEGRLAPIARLFEELMREMRSKEGELNAAEQEARQRVAQRTDALERMLSSLRNQANKDPLTGLNNRRMMENHLATLIDQSRGAGVDLCLLMLDLNNFKALNDSLGHAAGDDLLRSLGQIIRSTIRGGDVAFRCGGDEFVIVMPGVGSEAGQILSERLMSLVDGIARTLKTPRPVGLGIGAAALSELERPGAEALLEVADRRLYAMKQVWKMAGKGRGKQLAAR